MKKRPIGVIVVAVLLMIAGVAGLVGDGMNFKSLSASHYETVWIAAVHVLAIVAGVFLLRGSDWARWLTIAWMAFHVAISFLNSWQQAVMHGVILVLFVWILFSRDARAYFRSSHAPA